MVRKTVVRKNRYFDSVFLMQVARRIAGQPGIGDASALLATAANRKVLAGMGYGGDGDSEFAAAGPNDLVLALEGEAAAVETIAAQVDGWLSRSAEPGPGPGPGAAAAAAGASPAGRAPRSIAEAAGARPDSSVAVISVPGEYAAREARAALQAGLHVFLFSSNVTLEDERSLKAEARARGLIVMGPDCGTAYLGGAGVGFANRVRRGPIGMVGSTGTGMQEFACLVHQAGSGIANGIGTGSRDLTEAVGGLSTLAGIDALEADPATRVIAVLAKPPERPAAALLLERLGRCAKPVVLCLLGADPGSLPDGGPAAAPGGLGPGGLWPAATIDQAAALALELVGAPRPPWLEGGPGALDELARAQAALSGPGQRFIRGLFAGGTLCYQSQALFRSTGLVVHANSPIQGMLPLPDPLVSRGHAFIDMGAEVFVEGRPHPMIDAGLRRKRLEQEGEDPSVALVLLDFILGAMASPDPVGDMLGAIRNAQRAARLRGGHLCVAASVCGTDDDAQGFRAQTRALVQEGVLVFPSNARAAQFCSAFLGGLAPGKEVG